MKRDNKAILLDSGDPIEGLALAIVYSGVIEKDAKFFCSDWARTLFRYLDIETDPLDWYLMILMILDRKEREKHGSRRS